MSSSILKATIVCLAVILISSVESKQSRAIQNFACGANINQQIKREMEASQTYLSLANHFAHDSVALKGFSKFFKSSWKEELEHAEKLIDYVIMRGGNVETPSVAKPENDSKWDRMTACEIVNIALGLEMEVNSNLLKLHKCADESTDPQLQDFLEGNFLNEQVEAAKELADLLTRMERATKDSACDGLGLHIIDKEL